MRLRWLKGLLVAGLAAAMPGLAASADGPEPVTLKVVGGLAGVRQFTAFEQPFWEREIEALSAGRIKATIHPFDRSGIRGQDMLQLMKIGVVPFGNALLSMAASDTPSLQGIDLPGISPDFATLRQTIEAFRPRLKATLRDEYNVELLGVYSYPAQVLFCARAFDSLQGIGGFKVRTSSLTQSDLVTALGAMPVIMPFNEITNAMRRKSVDCAVTGILSGHEIGLTEVATHVHAQALSWGIAVFGANRTAWENLAPDVRDTITVSVRMLEERILRAAEADTILGFECSRGSPACSIATARKQVIVAAEKSSESVNAHVVRHMVLPQWLERCGEACEAIVAEGLIPALRKMPTQALSATTTGGGVSD